MMVDGHGLAGQRGANPTPPSSKQPCLEPRFGLAGRRPVRPHPPGAQPPLPRLRAAQLPQPAARRRRRLLHLLSCRLVLRGRAGGRAGGVRAAAAGAAGAACGGAQWRRQRVRRRGRPRSSSRRWRGAGGAVAKDGAAAGAVVPGAAGLWVGEAMHGVHGAFAAETSQTA